MISFKWQRLWEAALLYDSLDIRVFDIFNVCKKRNTDPVMYIFHPGVQISPSIKYWLSETSIAGTQA